MVARSIWSGSISFGLVNIPVKLVTAVRDKSIHFNLLAADGTSRLRRKLYAPETGKEYEYDQTVRGYEVAPDRYVIIKDEEIEKLRPEKSRRLDITEFVELAAVDPVYYDNTYYLAPDEGGAKAYALLVTAMKRTKRIAIARFVMREKQYLAAIRPVDGALLLHTMRYADEIVSQKDLGELPGATDLPKKEIDVAESLIKALEAEFDPARYKDDMRERLEKLIEAKAAGKDVVVAASEEREGPPVVDLMDALKKSLDRARKGAKAPAGKPSKARKKKTA
jgi:DNA end-binding protein Ku